MGKRVPDKNRCITVNLFHEGVFTVPPFQYAHSDENQITDIRFEGMSFVQFREVIRKLVQVLVASLYYCKVEHSGYDALDIRDQGETMADDGNESSDAYCFSDEEDLSYVDFHTEVNDNVVIKTVTTNDPFLNKLCADSPQYINLVDEPVNENVKTVVKDTENINPEFNDKNDWRKLLVYYGREVEAGRCAGRSKTDEGTSKSPKTPVKAITSCEGCSESPKWTKGSLVTYKRIAHHYAKQLIADPFIPYLKMKNSIREKFLINVSLGQCKRAKQRTLFDYEGGLREHYGRLWEYRQAILDSNPGSTCRLEDEETESGEWGLPACIWTYMRWGWVVVMFLLGREQYTRLGKGWVNMTWVFRREGPSSDTNQSALILRMESLKVSIGDWMVIPSGFHELEGKGSATMGESSATMSESGGAGGRSQRGRGRGQRVRGRGQRGRDEEEMTEDEIRKHLEHEYNKEILLEEEQKR
ncbi:hypothetical protein Tco_0559667 [Tanacetum coccineum]